MLSTQGFRPSKRVQDQEAGPVCGAGTWQLLPVCPRCPRYGISYMKWTKAVSNEDHHHIPTLHWYHGRHPVPPLWYPYIPILHCDVVSDIEENLLYRLAKEPGIWISNLYTSKAFLRYRFNIELPKSLGLEPERPQYRTRYRVRYWCIYMTFSSKTDQVFLVRRRLTAINNTDTKWILTIFGIVWTKIFLLDSPLPWLPNLDQLPNSWLVSQIGWTLMNLIQEDLNLALESIAMFFGRTSSWVNSTMNIT